MDSVKRKENSEGGGCTYPRTYHLIMPIDFPPLKSGTIIVLIKAVLWNAAITSLMAQHGEYYRLYEYQSKAVA